MTVSYFVRYEGEASEEFLRHYREQGVFHSFVTEGIKVRIEGHVPVRPVVRGEQA